MAHSGTIPGLFARTHSRFKSPIAAIYVVFGLAAVLMFTGAAIWGPVEAFLVFGTALTIAVLPIYVLAALACPIYYLRFRRSEFRVVLHLVVPLLGALFLIPAFFTGAGIAVLDFISPLSAPLSYAGPAVAVWYGAGIVITAVLVRRKYSSLRALSDHVAEDLS